MTPARIGGKTPVRAVSLNGPEGDLLKTVRSVVAAVMCCLCALVVSLGATAAPSPSGHPAAAPPARSGSSKAPARVPMGIDAVKAATAAKHVSSKAERDPHAVELVTALEKAVAGDGAWDKIAGLSFTQTYRHDGNISGEFRHTWDIRKSLFRVQGKADDGGERDVIFNPTTRLGEGWVQVFINPPADMKAQYPSPIVKWFHPPGPPQAAYIKFGYERYLNDTYWLLFPLKLRDPRIELTYEGEEALDGDTHDVVKVVLPTELELTTGRTYWIYLNRKTHLIDKWLYPSLVTAPQKGARRDPAHAKSWVWQDWKEFGPFKLSTQRVDPATNDAVIYKDIEILKTIPEKAFEPPSKPRSAELAQLKPANDKKTTTK